MWWVLCSPADRPAIWAACGLRARGVAPLEVVSLEALLLAPRWEHRIGSDGASASTVRLHDGRTLAHDAVRGVLNRVGHVPPLPPSAGTGDGAYIQQERAALLLSWLSSLPNVVNAPSPQGLPGPWPHPGHAQVLAAAAGLTVFPERYRGSLEGGGRVLGNLPHATAIVLDDDLFGARALAPMGDACVAFARHAGVRLAGLDFVRADGEWVFEAATPMPDLTLGGAALLDALAAAMRDA
jgi:hypothetical protein